MTSDETPIANSEAPPPDAPTAPPPRDWSLPQRLAFRLGFAYFAQYCAPLAFSHAPILSVLAVAPAWLDSQLVKFTASNIMHIKLATSGSNGSGDTTFNWIETATTLAVALLAAVVWSALDFKRKNYDRLYAWFRVLLRLGLGSSMISYGAYKVINSQFPPPGLGRMIETYGDSSPMGLLWTFMGSSTAYSQFVGFAELIGGLLLLIPRFTLLGALVSLGVMSNVFMLNMCYDVPVKLYSFHLLLISIILIAPDFQRFLDFFVRHVSVKLESELPLFSKPQWNNIAVGVQVVIGLFALVSAFDSSISTTRGKKESIPLKGLWCIDQLSISGVEQPLSDENRWQYMIFEHKGNVAVQHVNRAKVYYGVEWDGQEKNVTITSYGKDDWKAHFKIDNPEQGKIEMDGDFTGYPTKMKLHKVDESSFLLKNRGFHWINEYPFNR